jgi:hypothetical protein
MYSETDKLRCIERELKYREHVYPRLVSAGKMTKTLMKREIELLQAIRADYEPRAQAEKLV